jgi:hypothetical protein
MSACGLINTNRLAQVGVVTYLAPFLSALHPQARMEFIDICWELQGETDGVGWRFRKLLAQYACDGIRVSVCVRFSTNILSLWTF